MWRRVPGWHASVHEHCDKWTRDVRATLTGTCGLARRRQRATFLSARTLEWMEAKRCVQRTLRGMRRRAVHRQHAEPDQGPYIEAVGRLEWILAIAVQARVATDRDEYVNGLGDEVAAASRDKDARKLWSALRAVAPTRRNRAFRLQPLPMLLDGQGVPAASFAERGAIWQEHFCELEAGRIMPLPLIAEECSRLHARDSEELPAVTELVMEDLVDLGAWSATLAGGRTGRAAGPDRGPHRGVQGCAWADGYCLLPSGPQGGRHG